MEITNVHAREILDSRGNPTVEVEVEVEESVIGRAAVPSGASTGSHEARELRDGDSKRYLGKGVLTAVRNVNTTIAESLLGWDALDQISIDRKLIELDGTAQKSDLGANAMLGVSLAVARAAAEGLGQPLFRYLGGAGATELPVPLMNILNGGAHADNGLEIQEFMVVPHGFTSFSESLRAGVEIFHTLKALLKSKGLATSVGDEGGFAPRLDTNEKAIELVCESIVKAGFKLGTQVSIALDCAASEFYDGKTKSYTFDKQARTGDQLIAIYQDLAARYPIVSIEDGCAEDDWTTWKSLTDAMAKSVQLVGDDLFVTNKTRLIEGIQKKIANAILVKVNQIGTLTETLEAMKIARLSGYASIVSHRSGETEDHFIADLAVATSAGQIKTGSASRSDRLAKYNQLLRIEELLGKQATFGESSPFKSRAL